MAETRISTLNLDDVDETAVIERTSIAPAATLFGASVESPPTSRFAKWWQRLRIPLLLIVIGVLAVGIYRLNRVAFVVALVSVNLLLLAAAVLDRPSLRPAPESRWSAWVPRICYPLGLLLGIVVAVGRTNGGPRIAAIVVLVGLHAVAAAAFLTLLGHKLPTWKSISKGQLVASTVIGLTALGLAVYVDVQQVYRTFGIATQLYTILVIVAVFGTGAATINYMRSTTKARLPSLSVVVGFVCLVGGAVVVVVNLAVMAYWRNNDPVAGPPIHQLPPVPAFDGHYVALGDSYSAGEGLRPFEAFTDDDHSRLGDGCHRSRLAYSQLLRFEPPGPPTRFVACSGAVISDVFTSYTITFDGDQTLEVPAQVPPGEHPEVGLVTVTIGGNDAVFSRVVTHCFLRTNCLEAEFVPPRDKPDRGVLLPGKQPLGDWAQEVLTGPGERSVEAKIKAVYRRLTAAYPEARIIVIGYPYLFPDREAPFWNVTDCQTILRRFDDDERRRVRELQDQLNQVLHDAAAAAGIEFVSPAAGWDTHEPCGSSGEQYTNSIKPFLVSPLTGFSLGDGGTFHPNDAGQRELARLVTCYLIANPERPPLTAGAAPIGSIENPVPDCLQSNDD